MPGCRESEISVFCCACADAPDSTNPSAATAAQLRHIILFIPSSFCPVALTVLDKCTNTLVHLRQVPTTSGSPMDPRQIASRRPAPRSGGRLDRDRQAAPQVFERLRGMIISLELPPGSPLSRAALAEQFGVSSTPIRDALMRLEEEGLVEVFPQYATVVGRIDIALAQQAHFLRQALELEIVKALALQHAGQLIG